MLNGFLSIPRPFVSLVLYVHDPFSILNDIEMSHCPRRKSATFFCYTIATRLFLVFSYLAATDLNFYLMEFMSD